MSVNILIGDCRVRLAELEANSIDSCVTDPPYHLTSIVKRFGAANAAPVKAGKTGAYARASKGFMGQTWDGGDVAFDPETWKHVFRVLKPGAHLVAFSGTRTYHRMVCAIEDAGFEIRDQLAWIYGSGFPKSHDVSKGIDKLAGAVRTIIGDSPFAARKPNGSAGVNSVGLSSASGSIVTAPATEAAQQWEGWGTALKPAWEPIVLARKPLQGTVAGNVLKHGTGAINIDGCRVGTETVKFERTPGNVSCEHYRKGTTIGPKIPVDHGRWPANIIHDGSDEVLAGFPNVKTGAGGITKKNDNSPVYSGPASSADRATVGYDDNGSAARFFYQAKADSTERHAGCTDLEKGNNHPTVKPVDLMRWLCRLITPRGGTVLDPFAGSGSTLIAADAEQFDVIGCEISPEYADIAERRVSASGGMFAEVKAA